MPFRVVQDFSKVPSLRYVFMAAPAPGFRLLLM
jgi:hypothetical protein